MNEDNRAARILARPSARLFFLFCLLIAASFPWPGAQGALFFSGIPNQIVAEDTPTQPLSFTIFGGQGAITVAGSSDNTELIRIENIRITPLANDLWHVVVEPSTNQFGTATITLTARDSLNAIGSRSFPITVQPVNDPPIVRLLSPIPGKYAADLSIPISAEATDVEGALRSVELFLSRIEGTTATLTNSLATITSSPFNYTLQSVTTGFYDLWAKATDGGGSVSESPRVRIEVSRTPVPPPNYVQLLEGDSSAGSRRSFLVPILAFSYTNSVTLSYSTQSGSAIEGIDFQPLSNSTVVLDPGKITAPITNLVIYGNPVDDSPFRSFYLNWNGPNGVQLLANSTEIRILDDDEPPVVTISDAQQIIEGNPGTTNLVSFTLSLSSESHQPVFVEFATTGEGTATAGTDYSAVTEEDIDTNSIRIDPGFTTGQIKIQVVGDTLDEFDESFFVRLINASNATLDPVKNQARAIILDDDAPPTLSIFPTEVVEGNDGPTNAVFTASLSAPSGHPITAQYATTTDGTAASGVDFRSASGTLTFQPGETSKTVIVEVVGDTLHEGTETFFVALSNPTNASIAIPQAQGRIFDDEAAPVVSIQDAVAVLEGNTGTVNATFQVSLSAASAQAVTVVVATADATAIAGVDYTARTNTVAFNPGSPLTQTVSVDIRGDNLSEPDETFFVNLSDPVGATLGRNQATGTIKDDDPTPTISVFTTSVVEGNGTTNAVFDVRLSSPSGLSVAVSFATTNGTAIADSDYRPTQASVSFSPGETNQTIRIPVIGDAIHEDNETFLVRLSLPQNATIAIGEAEATILDDDPLPTISIQDTAVGEGNSGITNAVFLLTLSAPSGIPVSVGFSTANDSAVVDQDYNRAEGTLTFNSGQTNLTLSVAARGDLMNEAEEAFWVRLSSPTNATLARAEAKGIIVDDDPFPVLSIDDTAVLEGNAGATNAVFNVNLSVASGQTVTVSYATVDGTATAPREYSAASGTLTFAPGETTKTINVPVNGDTEDEPNETFLLRLSNPSHVTIQDAEAQAVIINDDVVPSLTIRDVSVTEGNSSTTNAVFLVALSQPSGRTVTVEFHTADGTATAGQDYSALTNKLTFNPGQTNHSISIAVSPETLHEANEVFFVNLVNPENATIAQKQARCAIVDDDPPPAILIGDVSIAEGDTGTKKATFSVRLAAPSGQGASVEFATTNGTAVAFADYLPAFGTLSFAPGETNATINVEIIGDIINESAEEFLVQLANPVNATITKGLGQCRITDDDPVPTLSINDVSVTEGDAGLSRAVFEIKLSAPGGQRITVKYAAVEETASAATDFVAQSSTLIFNPGETNKRITILVNGDTFFEPSETFSVNLSTPVNATITRGQGQATILDDDSEPAISINDLAVIEGSTGTTEAVFTVSLSVASLKTVSVDFAAAAQTATAGSDYVEQSGTLSFKPGETTKPVAIAIHGDLIDEPDEAFVINLSNAANATLAKAQGRGTITNDDETPSIIIRDATFVEGKSETTNVLVNVSLSAASSQRVTLAFTTTNGTATAFSDYKPSSGLLIFEPGETNKTITVEILGDDLHEPEEYLFVELASATHARLTSTQLKLLINDDDPLPVISIRDLTIAEGNDQPRKALFEVTLSSASSEEVTVDFASADETAIAGKDYFSAAGTLTFRSGQTFETIAVAVSADSARESNESFKVILSNPKNATLARSVAVGTILDDDSVPTLSINDISVIEGPSGTVNAVFALTLSAPSGETVSVNYATRDGTAAAGSDYQTQSGTVAFSPGETSKAIAVPVLGDLVNEPDEVFVLNLIQPVNATISRGQGTGTIRDDDPLPAISISDTAVTEGHSGTTNAEFVVTLSGPSGQLVTVDFSTSDGTATAGSDYEPRTSGQLTFKPGETRQTIAVAVIGEAVPEAEEFFLVRLSSPTQATILDGEAVGTITDDDKSVGISITDAAVLEPDTGTTNLVFIVSLSAPSSQLVSVAYATLDNTAQAGGDYASAFGSLTFLPGTTNQTLAVQVRGDTANEDDESFFVRLSDPTNAVILDNRAIGTITDNDPPPTISIAEASVTEGNSGSVNANFTVTLSSPSAKFVSFNFVTIEGTATAGQDFQSVSDTRTFLPGTTNMTVSVPVNGDTEDEANETFAVVLNRPVNATVENSRALGTILNDDVLPTLLITDASVREGNVGTSFAEFTVRLSTPSTQPVTVEFKTADRTATAGIDYTATAGKLTFVAGTTTNVVRVPILGDATVEPNETFEVRLSNANHARIVRPIGVGTILDDDVLPTLTITDASVVEGNSGSANAIFALRLSTASVQLVSVGFQTASGTATAGTDFKTAAGTIEFPPGTVDRTLSVEVIGDTAFEADETFLVNLANPVNAIIALGRGVGTIRNDDSPANQPPTVRIIHPANGAALTAPAEVSVTVDAFDRDGSVSKVEFFVGSTLLGSATSSPYTIPWSNEAAGAYSLTARATDDKGAVAVSEPANVLISRRAAGAEVAIVRNFADPEISLIQNYLLEMGISSQVFEQEGLSFDALRDARLVIWNDLGSEAQGLTDQEVTIFRQAFDAGIPLYFIGETLAASTRNLSASLQSQWAELIHLTPGAANRSDGTILIEELTKHPVVSGHFGTVGRFNGSPNVEGKLRSEEGVTLLGRSGAADLIAAFEDPLSDGRIRTVTQNCRMTAEAHSTGITEQKKLFRNAVAWLMRKSFQALTDLSVEIEGPSDSVAVGSEFTYTITVQHQGEIEGTGAVVTISLGTGLKLSKSEFLQGTLAESNGTVFYTLGNMASAQRSTLSLVLLPTIGGTLTTRVNVSGNEPDPNAFNNTTTAETVVTGAPLTLPALRSVGFNTQGFQLNVTGTAPGIYRVQASADLSRWIDLTNFTGRSTPVLVIDPGASRMTPRFYRVISP